MKYYSQKLLSTFLLIIVIFSISGCSSNTKEKAYQNYVKSLISVNYLGATSDYIKATGANEDDAKDLYDSNISHLSNNLKAYYSLDFADESDSMTKLNELSKNIYSKVKFNVSKAYKEGNDYFVDVTIEPINILNDTNTSINDYVTEFNTQVNEGVYRDYTKEEFEAKFADGLITILTESINTVTYGEAQVLKVKIITTDSTYYISDEDLILIDSNIIAGSTPISSISETVTDVLKSSGDRE